MNGQKIRILIEVDPITQQAVVKTSPEIDPDPLLVILNGIMFQRLLDRVAAAKPPLIHSAL
jgi:hypothetical protein